MKQILKVGTRKSPLAIKQTEIVIAKIKQAFPNIIIEVIPISTSGDEDKTTPLWQIGGKGVFIKTLEKALLEKK